MRYEWFLRNCQKSSSPALSCLCDLQACTCDSGPSFIVSLWDFFHPAVKIVSDHLVQ